MSLLKRLGDLLWRLTDYGLSGRCPRGPNIFQDIQNSLPHYRGEVVFDVGANVGQSAKQFLEWFPTAEIYCFEPVSASLLQLKKNIPSDAPVKCFRLAFGSAAREGVIHLEDDSKLTFLEGQAKDRIRNGSATEAVNVDTLDRFCSNSEIPRISYLKIDTEGGDLDVLQGGERMLSEQRIDLVELEAGMNPGNNRHVPFEILKRHLESRDYALFGIYEQVNEWPTGEPHLRRSNPVFISRSTINANRR